MRLRGKGPAPTPLHPNQLRDRVLPKKPHGTITESHVRILDEHNATHSGNYRFSDKDSGKSEVDARFTYVYEKIDGRWLIVEHHSSAAPEKD